MTPPAPAVNTTQSYRQGNSILIKRKLDEFKERASESGNERTKCNPRATAMHRDEDYTRRRAVLERLMITQQLAREANNRLLEAFGVQRAEQVQGELSEWQENLDVVLRGYESACAYFQQENGPGYGTFIHHAQSASIITSVPVRYFDLLRWFQHALVYSLDALKHVAHYYYKESELLVELHGVRKSLDHRSIQPAPEIDQAAAALSVGVGADMEDLGFGLEDSAKVHLLTVGSYVPQAFNDEAEEVEYIRAAFNMHIVRLEHEHSHLFRYPFKQPFGHSLDYSTLAFIRNVLACYFTPS